jgi:hypothetical protein
MKTKQCKMKQACCLVTFCPLVPSWATLIRKFQGFEAGFDRNDQNQHLIIDPGDIKSEQQQPGILYVARCCANHHTSKTDIENTTNYLLSNSFIKSSYNQHSTKKQRTIPILPTMTTMNKIF